jgi:hypothetical protein
MSLNAKALCRQGIGGRHGTVIAPSAPQVDTLKT